MGTDAELATLKRLREAVTGDCFITQSDLPMVRSLAAAYERAMVVEALDAWRRKDPDMRFWSIDKGQPGFGAVSCHAYDERNFETSLMYYGASEDEARKKMADAIGRGEL